MAAAPEVNGDGPTAITQPPLRTTARTASDSELGNHLLETRGLHWIHAANGDPYAVVLRAQLDDPCPEYARVRTRGPLSFSPTGSWVTADHALAAQALGSPDLGLSTADGRPVPQQVLAYGEGSPLELGPDARARLSQESARTFAPEALERHRATVDRVHQDVLRTRVPGPATGQDFELMGDFVRPAVTAATAAVLGVPEELRQEFATCAERLRLLPDSLLAPQSLWKVRSALDGLAELDALSAALPDPAPGTGARPLRAQSCALGVTAAAHLAGNAVLALLDDRSQWRQVCETPELAAHAVEETLRHDPPVQLDARTVLRETELAGRRLRAGTHVVVLTAAAGRDPSVFADPDRFDLGRQNAAAHLALHESGHHGAVAPLVRLQAQAALRALATRFPGLRQAGPVLRARRTPVSRGPLSVRMTT
ncbi:P450-derived glycosyltransferase activator [Streptomyces sp. RY43-2]|uniref:P450-derived glycosyltransferase activator n=1 Tax=Streptomyces macrolidinus TaxID=2952607 RepID=A0ABT0ZLF4_9ACTN|nr:P450-derived glycosyltransferase activator [Streptomyces macrolidinus]MCN9244373.1 P450-derived glycosyltransferase activator [Streptomyces macrolidinus]